MANLMKNGREPSLRSCEHDDNQRLRCFILPCVHWKEMICRGGYKCPVGEATCGL
ncbi:hypothetical protein LR48_Vigan03g101000 [Vigna angularis]|uniref:Uncharacterized protein n=1 Tax=Phaseolus angularis TaxID=3914 RepID=A0A0L9U473_PHAAN|nr:hypothetical protein LR48_Vigan03g101000 [Vigna angularis]